MLSLLRSVTGTFLSTVWLPLGFSIRVALQPFFFSDSSSSQRVEVGSPCFRKSCKWYKMKSLPSKEGRVDYPDLSRTLPANAVILILGFDLH